MFTGTVSQAPAPPPSSRSRAQGAKQPPQLPVQQLSTATCTWSVQHIFIFSGFEHPSLNSDLLLSAGDQAAQSCRLCVEQDNRQTTISSRMCQRLNNKFGQPGLSHRASCCALNASVKYCTVGFVFDSFMSTHFKMGISRLMSGGGCNDKSPKEQLSSHSSPALQEPGENCQSFRSAGSPQEETGMIYVSCLRDCRMMTSF